MITEAEMYWITRLDHFGFAIDILVVLSLLVTATLGIAGAILLDSYDGSPKIASGKRAHRWAIASFCVAVGLFVGLAFVPSTKEYAAIKIVPAIANNETLQKDGSELYKLAVGWAKEKLGAKAEDGK